jgi:hypothetical protein
MKNFLILLILIIGLISCADPQPQIGECLKGHTYGFWGGLWHGFIAPFSFIGSLFSDDIAVWAQNNNGSWYNFGFLLGVGAFASGSKYSKK